MSRDEIQKLLGGYATGTLTAEEQRALFAAALEDQELFDALGREQVLRDMLRDPGAKAELLAALDTPPERAGFWGWLRRPLVAGLATAGVAAIACIAVWHGTRARPVAQPVLVAEVKPQEPVPAAMPPAAAVTRDDLKVQEAAPRVKAKENAPAPPGMQAPMVMRDAKLDQAAAPQMKKTEAAGNSIAPAFTTQSVEVTALAPPAAAGQAGALSDQQKAVDKLAADARSLFYANSFAPRAGDAVVPLAGGVGGAMPGSPARVTTLNAAKSAATSVLGLRVSLLRGDEEAPINSELKAGESVRLKILPNEDGFLYVAARVGDAWKMVASGPAERLKAFVTPPLPWNDAGEKQLNVMLSRTPQSFNPQALAGFARGNLVETRAAPDRATYVVAQTGAPHQVAQSITLTFR